MLMYSLWIVLSFTLDQIRERRDIRDLVSQDPDNPSSPYSIVTTLWVFPPTFELEASVFFQKPAACGQNYQLLVNRTTVSVTFFTSDLLKAVSGTEPDCWEGKKKFGEWNTKKSQK